MEQNTKNVSPFSNENRNLYVKEHLTEALIQLLRAKQMHEIGISEVCDLAGVGRTSFYRNYETKEDILRSHIVSLLEEWEQNCGQISNITLSHGTYLLFSHFEEHKDFYAIVYQRGYIYMIKDYLLKLLKFNPTGDLASSYASAYVAFLIYGWIEVWFRRGMKDSAAEIAKLIPDIY